MFQCFKLQLTIQQCQGQEHSDKSVGIFESDRLSCHVVPGLNIETADIAINNSHNIITFDSSLQMIQEFDVTSFVNDLANFLTTEKQFICGDLNINALEHNLTDGDNKLYVYNCKPWFKFS